MDPKFAKVEVLIDTTDLEQVGALLNLFSKIGKTSKHVVGEQPAGESMPEPVPITRRRRSSKKEEPELFTPDSPAEASQPDEAEDAGAGLPPSAPAVKPASGLDDSGRPVAYRIEEVREKLKEKVSDHRERIKLKLTDLGAPNVSSLDASKYGEFMQFLNSLE